MEFINKDFELLKEKLIKDVEEIIEFHMRDFLKLENCLKNYEEKNYHLENIKEWAEARKELYELDYSENSYNYLVKYYDERGWKKEKLNEVFHEFIVVNQVLGIIYELKEEVMEKYKNEFVIGWNSALDNVYKKVFELIED